ncbi:hypothetical protein [Xylophilus sp. GOD-11R]|uniref:hypothetical protein n=1 Tax=Xylophilus sp. GOD-11R TaxID=3089814 RepID=UPI00298CBB85|nr:hypothetical protein [Xylophilus sp. GOD-11R]WPB58632.1 hypothetical protein R9X41_08350 [Xylophilus sp. GOD-11R]
MAGKKQKRVHLLSAVNAANVSKDSGVYTIKNVCGAVDDIVMNSVLYPAAELATGAKTLDNKPAPAGHPKNDAGQHISATNGDALFRAWIGSYCTNSRHEGGRTVTDIRVNEKQARASDVGARLIDRLDAAIAGTNAEAIHVSTGLYFEPVVANGESRGKKYSRIATNLQYDHLAILLDERGAGTPEEGVGMFLNSAGEEEEIETVEVNAAPDDRRADGLKGWLSKLLGNGSELSFDQIDSGLRALLPEGAWPREVYAREFVWTDRDGNLWKQGYAVSADASLAFVGEAVAVKRKVDYVPITNSQKDDQVKENIIAALNAAGISGVAAMTDAQLLASFEAVKAKPHVEALAAVNEKLVAANSQIAGFEAKELAATNAERDTLAIKLAANSSLTADDFKAMPLARLKELDAKAAPVVVGNTQAKPGDEFAGYDLNKLEA